MYMQYTSVVGEAKPSDTGTSCLDFPKTYG